jgi:hypothetical protein
MHYMYLDFSHPVVYPKVLKIYKLSSQTQLFILVNYACSDMFRLQGVIIRLLHEP